MIITYSSQDHEGSKWCRFNSQDCCSWLYQLQGFPGGSVVKNPPAVAEGVGLILDQENPLKKEMATHFNILAWEIPWIEEPGGP